MNDQTDLLTAEIAVALAADPSVPTDVLTPPPRRGLFGVPVPNLHTFRSLSWETWKGVWGCRWDRAGRFEGALTVSYGGNGQYQYLRDLANPFRFHRWNGTVVEPENLTTDGASVPRILWSVPGLSAVDYLPAAVLHDWLFARHRGGLSEWSFEDANSVLAEAIYTMMVAPADPYAAPEDWRVVVAYHAAVSKFGKKAWVG